jgi:hypothetical protein
MMLMKPPAASACRCSVSTKQRARKGNGRNRRGRGRRRRRDQYDLPVHHHPASMFERCSWNPRLVGGWRNPSEVRRSASSSSPQSIRYHSQFQSSHLVDLGLLISVPGRSMISKSLFVRDSLLSTTFFMSRQSKLKQTSISQVYRTSTTSSSCRAVRIM